MSEEKSFFEEQILAQRAAAAPIADPVVEPVIEPVVEPVLPIVEPVLPAIDAVIEPVVVPATKNKIKVEYKEWLETNKGTIQEYLSNKDKDYSSLSQEEAVALKVRKENPYYNSNDIKDELAEKYGIGLKPIEIDETTMDTQEIAEAKSHNSRIERGQRILKGDAAKAKKEFEDYKGSLVLPEFEYEVDAPAETLLSVEDYQAQNEKYRDEVWVPELTKATTEIGNIKKTISFSDNGTDITLDVDLELSAEDKASLVSSLSDYQVQTSDAKYVKADGSPDISTFLKDKAQDFFFEKVLKQAVSNAYEQGKKGIVKNSLLNFDDGITPIAPITPPTLTKQQRVEQGFFNIK